MKGEASGEGEGHIPEKSPPLPLLFTPALINLNSAFAFIFD
jgi:hypothetical protein